MNYTMLSVWLEDEPGVATAAFGARLGDQKQGV